jgi:hypothetical protein
MKEIWVMLRNRTSRQLTQEEIDELPSFVIDTLEIGCLAVSSHVNGLPLMYGLSKTHLEKE